MITRRLRWMILGVCSIFAGLAGASVAAVELAARWQPSPIDPTSKPQSTLVLDSNGNVLRGFLASDGRWRLRTRVEDVPATYLQMLLAYEDQRFWQHSGIDMVALARATIQLVTHQRIVSGGSTLTMQVARLLEPRPRSLAGKLRQIVAARRLELQLTKREILELYLTLAPFGGNIESVRAASLTYLGREPRDLDVSESALLIAIPQAPELRRPDRHGGAAWSAARQIVSRLEARGLASHGLAGNAGNAETRRPRLLQRAGLGFAAPHLAERLRAEAGNQAEIRSLVEAPLQGTLEAMVQSASEAWPETVSAAVLVVRNVDRGVVAYVSGPDFASEPRAGQLDLVQAIRSPGSTLKPFIYAMAFEQRLVHPATIVTDEPIAIGGYEPRNFSGGYDGDLTIRQALVRSTNTTPIALLRHIRPQRFANRMASAGIPFHIDGTIGEAGLAIGLGGVGIRLSDLVRAYAALATDGRSRPLRYTKEAQHGDASPLLEPDAVWAVTEILSGMPPPKGFVQMPAENGEPRIAYKTGTSYGFRDAWAVGFDHDHTVGVWVGRPDGSPHLDAYGISAAAPILFRIFDILARPARGVVKAPPSDTILASSTDLPPRLQRFGGAVGAIAGTPRQTLTISFPRDGTTIELPATGAQGGYRLALSARGGRPPVSWLVNDNPIDAPRHSSETIWQAATPGAARIVAIDADGQRDAVEIWLEPSHSKRPDASESKGR